MRTSFLIVLGFVLLCTGGSHASKVRQARNLSVSCELVLSKQLCQNLRDIAINLKLAGNVIDDAVREVVKRGIKQVPEVVQGVKDYLKQQILTKKCEDLIAQKICERVHRVAAMLKVSKDKVDAFIKDLMTNGVPSPTEIVSHVFDKLRAEVTGLKCDDFVAADVCTKLREIATGLKTDIQVIDAFVKDAIIAGFERRDEIFQAVLDFLRNEVLSLTCDDILNANICGALRSLAKNFKLTQDAVDRAVKEAIIMGKKTADEILEFGKNFLKTQVLSKKCEDLIPTFICTRLRSIANRFKVRAELVDSLVKEAIVRGKTRAKDIITFVTGLLKKYIKCEDWLSNFTCKTVRSVANRLGVGIRDVEAKLQDIIASGKSLVSDIYREIINYIKMKVFG